MANKKKYHKPQIKNDYNPPYPADILALPLESLKLREETKNLLVGAGLSTIRDLAIREEKDFYRIHTFNKKNLFDVKNALKVKKVMIKPTAELSKQNGTTAEQGEKVAAVASTEKVAKSEKPVQNKEKPVTNKEKPIQNKANPVVNKEKPAQNKANPVQNKEKAHQEHTKSQKNDKYAVDENFEMTTLPKKPPKPKVVPIKEEPDIYVKVSRGGKWGFKDRNGKQVVEPLYDEVFNYKEDICCVEKEERFGYINRHGELIVPIIYDCATSFSEGYACVFKREKCGYINTQNETVVEFRFDAGTPVKNGECRVKKDGKWGEMHLIKGENGEVKVSEIRWIN